MIVLERVSKTYDAGHLAVSEVSLLGSTEKMRTWSHPVVPLGGNVRSQSVDSTMSMVLLEFGLTGAYLIFVGGATTTVEALAQAAGLLGRGECARALVLAVETFRECQDLHARGRWLLRR